MHPERVCGWVTVQSSCTQSCMNAHALSYMHSCMQKKCTCTNRGAIKGTHMHTHTDTPTHTHTRIYRVIYLSSAIHTRPDSPSPSSAFHVMSSSLTPWPSSVTETLLPEPWFFLYAQSPLLKPFSRLWLCRLWPFTPDPLTLLLYSCMQRISISVDRLHSAGMSVGSMCPWNCLGLWYECWAIGELAWAGDSGRIEQKEDTGQRRTGWQVDNRGQEIYWDQNQRIKESEEEDKWGQSDKTERGSDTR